MAATLGAAGDAVDARERTQFEEFAASRWAGLVRLAFGLTGDRWLAEDLAQTALASAYAAWWRVGRAHDPDAYVRRILINASKRRFRRGRISERPSDPGALPDTAVADPAAEIGERSALLTAIAGLPPRQRAVVLAAAAVLAVPFITAPGPAPNPVKVNAPNPNAPGGVFASGTADGKPWQLAVRNIAAGPWCLPAVMLNGRDGNVLFRTAREDPSVGHPAFLRDIPGLPGTGAMVTQVTPGVTRLAATFPGGRKLAVHPVRVAACGQSVYLAWFLFADPRDGVSQLATYSRHGLAERLFLTDRATGRSVFAAAPAGIWANLDKSPGNIAASQANRPIGTSKVDGRTWHMNTGLGLFGQCYAATLRGGGHSRQCAPVAAPPRTIAVTYVPIPYARSHLAGYAGPVSPRTASVVAEFSSGLPRTYRPVDVAGRKYVAIVAPPDNVLDRVSLFDSAGHEFGSAVAPVGGMTGTLPIGK